MVRLQPGPIDPAELAAAVRTDADGAVASFVGTVRELNRGRRVLRLEYSAWGEMALSEMERIEREALARFSVSRVAIVHRTGLLEVGEASVAIVVAAPHRAAACDACRFAIETLKRTVPIWKKEIFEGGEEWIEGPGEGCD